MVTVKCVRWCIQLMCLDSLVIVTRIAASWCQALSMIAALQFLRIWPIMWNTLWSFFFSARQHYSKGTLFVKKKIHQCVNAFRASINIGAKQLKVKDHILAKLLQIVLKLCLERHDSFMDMYWNFFPERCFFTNESNKMHNLEGLNGSNVV